MLQRGADLPDGLGQSFSPHLGFATTFQRRSDGAAMSSGLDLGRELEDRGAGTSREVVIEVEFTEDGTVRLMTTRFSDEVDAQQVLFPTMMPILVRQLVGVAAEVSQAVSYGGLWYLGLGATGISGLPVYSPDSWGRELQ
ncbi:MAG: hypothetical protein WAR57_11135 [Candidatus Phosphoribacter sp.]